ncbi:LexA family protein [Streptomyces europaeiscabiei]|uniref:LexA family protein n=1 Tax=Streptomyces europaeiscabiei TaxID=146819 RepID=UPI0038F71E37
MVEQHVEDVLALPRQIVGAGEYGDLVVLTVSGCSMVGAHILDGDQVVIRLMPDCVSGDDRRRGHDQAAQAVRLAGVAHARERGFPAARRHVRHRLG